MKNISKMLIVAGAAAGLAGAAFIAPGHAQTGQTQAGPAKSHAAKTAGGFRKAHFRGRSMGRRGVRRGRTGERLFQIFDADKNGKLTQKEIDKARAGRLAEYDTDKDGKLSLKEYQPLWLNIMRRRMVDRFQRLDEDGDGRVTGVEFTKPLSSIVVRLDRDEDGSLTRKDFRR